MDPFFFLRHTRPAHQSKRLALSFPLHFSFSAAELIQAFYHQITSLHGISQSHSRADMTACNDFSQQR